MEENNSKYTTEKAESIKTLEQLKEKLQKNLDRFFIEKADHLERMKDLLGDKPSFTMLISVAIPTSEGKANEEPVESATTMLSNDPMLAIQVLSHTHKQIKRRYSPMEGIEEMLADLFGKESKEDDRIALLRKEIQEDIKTTNEFKEMRLQVLRLMRNINKKDTPESDNPGA